MIIREAGFIKDGYNEEVDRLRAAARDGKGWLADVEIRERERTGIPKLKLKFNKVFGYYLEVPNSFRDKVPEDYMRKQTLVNAERYITPELKELEETILGASDKLNTLEYELFVEIREKIADNTARIQATARAIASADVFASLAYVAERNRYVCPKINDKGVIDIHDGRHPVVEQMAGGDLFVPNDTLLDNRRNRVSIITGDRIFCSCGIRQYRPGGPHLHKSRSVR